MWLWTNTVRRWCARSVTLTYRRRHQSASIVCHVDTSAVLRACSVRGAGIKLRGRLRGPTGISYGNNTQFMMGVTYQEGYRDGNQPQVEEEVTQQQPGMFAWKKKKEVGSLWKRPANRPKVAMG